MCKFRHERTEAARATRVQELQQELYDLTSDEILGGMVLLVLLLVLVLVLLPCSVFPAVPHRAWPVNLRSNSPAPLRVGLLRVEAHVLLSDVQCAQAASVGRASGDYVSTGI